MGKLTKDERAELERQLAEDDAEEDDDEYELGFADGSYVRGRHSRVSKVAAARGVKVDPDPPAAGDGKDAKDAKGAAKGQQGGQVRAFGRRVS